MNQKEKSYWQQRSPWGAKEDDIPGTQEEFSP